MYKSLKKQEVKKYYSEYYPKILSYWQKYGHEPRPKILKRLNIKKKRILDIGCRDGSMLKDLLKQNEVYGIDISTKLLKKAKKIGIKTLCCDINKKHIPYPESYFDLILLFEIIEHVFFPESVFRKCFRLLKSKGKIYMTLPNRLYPRRIEIIQKSLESALDHAYKGSIPEKAKRFPDINILTLNRIGRLLSKTGFKIKKVYGWSWAFEALNPKERQRLWMNPLKASDLLIIAEKTDTT